jgi:organic radical activating enzyme
MLIEATRAQGWFWVDWWLTNHCSWHCTYCPDILKSGSITQVSLKDSQQFLSELAAYAASLGLKPRIKFTGGEPTEWAPLVDLLATADREGCYLSLRSNASCDRTRWQAVIEHLDDVEMNFHPEHTQTSVFMLNLDRSVSAGLNVRAVFNMLPQRFEEIKEVIDRVTDKYPQVSIERRMLFEDPGRNQQPKAYSEPQKAVLIRQSGDIRITTDGITSYTDYPTMISDGSNKFEGFNCRAGLEQLIIDAWGRVRRGHCGQGGSMGTIGGSIMWPTQELVCRRPSCDNAFDILSTKISV